MTNRDLVVELINKNFPQRAVSILEKLDIYFNWLVEINQKINLISRKTEPDEYWTLHFLDTLLITDVVKFKDEYILDFGTGGGLPGIPLAILYPNAKIFLLDARKKKLAVIAEVCELLDLDNVELIHGRAEEVAFHFASTFNVIVSRSVRITKELKKPLLDMLANKGKIYFYKSLQLDDMCHFKKRKTHNVSCDEIGTRRIVEAWK